MADKENPVHGIVSKDVEEHFNVSYVGASVEERAIVDKNLTTIVELLKLAQNDTKQAHDPASIRKLADQLIAAETANLREMASVRENSAANPLTHNVNNYAPPAGVTLVEASASNIAANTPTYTAVAKHGFDPKDLGLDGVVDRFAAAGSVNVNARGEFESGGVDLTAVKHLADLGAGEQKVSTFAAAGLHGNVSSEGKVTGSVDVLGVAAHSIDSATKAGAYLGTNYNINTGNLTQFAAGELKINADTPYSTNLQVLAATDEFKKGTTSLGLQAVQNLGKDLMIKFEAITDPNFENQQFNAGAIVRF